MENELTDGVKWTVFHQTREMVRTGRTHPLVARINQSSNSDVEALLMNSMEFFLNYDKVATFNFHGMGAESLFRLTNNVDESWLSEFDGEHNNWTMEKHSDEENARSSMVGDIFQDKTNMVWFVIQPLGFKRIFWLENEQENSGFNVSPKFPNTNIRGD